MSGKIITIVGARPQFVKAAAVSRALAKFSDIQEILVHTGQHFDTGMSEVFFDELDIPSPAYNLGISGGTHGSMTARMLAGLEQLMQENKVGAVLIYGDTNSTLAGALAASKLHIPIAHVEAGLRSYNRRMPEEINRVLSDHLSSLLFCPSSHAVENLEKEGIQKGVIHVGDVMYDSTLFAIEKAKARSNILMHLNLEDEVFALATVHRAENTGDRKVLSGILDYLREQAAGTRLVMPLHPRTKAAVSSFGLSLEGIDVIEPVGYLDMTSLLQEAASVFTDSGGLQKEAYFHGKPCVTLRTETEWVETIQHGWNRLWTVSDYLPRSSISEYGNGDAAERIVECMLNFLSTPANQQP